MKIIVLGAGVIGVTSAYALAQRGHEVTIIERNSSSAEETSFSNGGQLSYSHAEPWANPSTPAKLPKWVLDETSPLVIRPRADWQMVAWGVRFLSQCFSGVSRRNCVDILRLGLYSREKLKAIREQTGIEFLFSSKGIIHIFNKLSVMEHEQKQFEFQQHYGCEHRMLSRDEVLAMEPSLVPGGDDIIGGLHASLNECGDSYLYCQALCKYMQEKMGVNILYNTTVQELNRANDHRISSVKTDKGEHTADAYVVCMASDSMALLPKGAVNLPIYPMKGYSITAKANDFSPKYSITDANYKVVYTPLGDSIRVAGTAEFAGFNTDITESRIAPMIDRAKALFPKMDWETRTEWACLRPATPDGPPRIGKTSYQNLYINTGHGTLGWTQCAGSAYILADIMEDKEPDIQSNGPMVRN